MSDNDLIGLIIGCSEWAFVAIVVTVAIFIYCMSRKDKPRGY